MRIIGAGFGRTGTLSLKAALERLGFAPCNHMLEVMDRPELIHRWLDIAEGRSADWDGVLGGFDATLDWPASAYWRELAAHYPDAKVLLTVRDPEEWYESMRATIFRRRGGRTPLGGLMAKISPDFRAFRRMARAALVERALGGETADRARLVRRFQDHVREVREAIPAARLLVYDVRQGWEPLCAFLGVPVPSEPFPRLNDREHFGRHTRRFMLRTALRLSPARGRRPPVLPVFPGGRPRR
ncbi:sulfotransferase family protein [Sphaerisporangium album]|uniref:Sulfotransferase family protein n=1 Tax=Sphaerisporangium album TaxID=509200 RepID=A0A367F0V0_9ACTN|nr:sulfotransferase family protein [Sphaerisporangium album]RCG23996.1 sulfotransferase family protein [Sphaerisporangium album]